MALHLAYRYHRDVAGVFALSAFLNKGSAVYKVYPPIIRVPSGAIFTNQFISVSAWIVVVLRSPTYRRKIPQVSVILRPIPLFGGDGKNFTYMYLCALPLFDKAIFFLQKALWHPIFFRRSVSFTRKNTIPAPLFPPFRRKSLLCACIFSEKHHCGAAAHPVPLYWNGRFLGTVRPGTYFCWYLTSTLY